MTIGQAIVYGIVQGLTEYLPISSTAHLAIVPSLLGWENPNLAFKAIIQLGTLVAVLWYFRTDIMKITSATVRDLLAGKPLASAESQQGWMIVVGTVPVVAAGLLLKEQIKSMNDSLHVMASAMIVLALVLMVAEWLVKRRAQSGIQLKEMGDLGWLDAIVVGLAQAVALIPGSSRSGVTITGGLFLGMTRETAARFSFLLSLPAVFAAGMFELYSHRKELLATHESEINLLVATVISLVVGYASIAFLLGYLKRHTTYLFIIYRLVLGAILLALLFTGKL